jgi:cysteine desulfurase
MIYLDWAASSPPEPAVLEEAREISLRYFANPSSPHAAGREANEKLSDARARFARVVGADPLEIVFTSGGTESNSMLLLSLLDKRRLGGMERKNIHIVSTAIEHSSVYEQARSLAGFGIACTFVSPRSNGLLDPNAIRAALDDSTVLVSVILTSNETGAIQNIAEIARSIREFSEHKGRRILLHTDAVQALGKIPFSVHALDVEAASFSGHKIGTPRGIGALYLRSGANPGFLSLGGGQEGGRRSGTENLAGACCLALAAEVHAAKLQENLDSAEKNAERLIGGLRQIAGARIFPETRTGADAKSYSPYIVSAGFPPLPGEVVVRIADGKGFRISTGSACSSKKKDRTRAAESMGLSKETALSVFRISIGPATSADEIDGFLRVIREEIPPLFKMSRGRG